MPIRVINIIPQSQSAETNRDSEPNITVNPSNPQQIVVSAFTPDPASPPAGGPYFWSGDGGQTWSLNVAFPGDSATRSFPLDISVRFGGSLDVLLTRDPIDQPWVEAATQWNTDRVYVSSNDFTAPSGRTASVDISVDAATAAAPAGFTV